MARNAAIVGRKEIEKMIPIGTVEIVPVGKPRKAYGSKIEKPKKIKKEYAETPGGLIENGKKLYDNKVHPHAAYQLCAEHGFTNLQLARVFGVSIKTIDSWLVKHADFKKSVLNGKDDFDTTHVEQALLKRALGFEFEKVMRKHIKLKRKTDEGLIEVPAMETTIETVYYPPDTKAASFWLINRNKERWRNMHKISADITKTTQHTEIEMKVDLSKMSVEQLQQLKQLRQSIVNSVDGKLALPAECRVNDEQTEKMMNGFIEAAYEVIEEEDTEEV